MDRPPSIPQPRRGAAAPLELRAMPGRTTRLEGGGSVAVVSKTFVGDEPRDWWFERLHRWRVRSPAEREHRALEALGALGLAVPGSLGFTDQQPPAQWLPPRPGRGAGCALRIGWVEHAEDARSALERRPDPNLIKAIAALVVRLHGARWYHRDLNLGHLVVGSDGAPVLLDLGRARCQTRPRRRWFVKDLAALQASAPPSVSRPARLRFLRLWLEGVRGVDRADRRERRRWVEGVLGKARRMARRPPRHSGAPRREAR